ncbi:prepilin-type N-terminal cleavage/methylation domain-containing protein [Candidatus Methylomirabilis sp.]|uniref:PulJ/GspJ family protein n=1 Tax=Candidatus Methylomirabilis sp. TaxID=2032687 RepID=UPI002A6734C9|nr:prepilin-type N-terminal cleavage/methylation domain-containing protein [Candidatus Methylomirabilis sp.]
MVDVLCEVPTKKSEAPHTVSGFTLLEVLISLTILALIFVAVLGAIQIGVKSWESGEARAEESQRTRALVDALARDLTTIYPLRVKELDKDVTVFRGSSDSLTFATLPQSYGAEPFSHMIRMVTYAVESGRGLVATESYPMLGPGTAQGSQEERAKQIDERVSEVRFRYLVPEGKPEERLPPVWRELWDPSRDRTVVMLSLGGPLTLESPYQLPLAVEMTVLIRQAKQGVFREVSLPPLVFPVQVGRTL